MIPELHNHLEIDFDTVLDANALPQKVVRRWPNERENKRNTAADIICWFGS